MTTLLQVFDPLAADFTGTSVPPNFGVRNGHRFIAFDDGLAVADEECFFENFLAEAYAGNDINALVTWMAASAITGDAVFEIAFERHDDEGLDLDGDSFAVGQTIVATAPATSGATQYTTIVFTSAQIDGLLAGERFRIRVRLVNSDSSYTIVGDVQVTGVKLLQAKNESQITIQEQDGSPLIEPLKVLKVDNTTLIDEGDGVASLETGGGGGGGGFFSDGVGLNAGIGAGTTSPVADGDNSLAQGDNVVLTASADRSFGLGQNIDFRSPDGLVLGFDIQSKVPASNTGSPRSVIVGSNIDLNCPGDSVIVGQNLSIGGLTGGSSAGERSVIVGQGHLNISGVTQDLLVVGNANNLNFGSERSIVVGNNNNNTPLDCLVVGEGHVVTQYDVEGAHVALGKNNTVYGVYVGTGGDGYINPVFAHGENISVYAHCYEKYGGILCQGKNLTITGVQYQTIFNILMQGSFIVTNGDAYYSLLAQGYQIQIEGQNNLIQGSFINLFGTGSQRNLVQGRSITFGVTLGAAITDTFAQGRDHTVLAGIDRGFVQGFGGRVIRDDQKCWPADDSVGSTGASQYNFMPKGVSTTDATQTTLATLTLDEDKAYAIWAYIVARNTTTPDENAIFVLTSAIAHRETAGAAQLVGTPIALTRTDTGGGAANLLADLAAVGNDIVLRVIGEVSETYRWTCVLHFIERIG